MREAIGALLCALPFLGFFAYMVRESGWRVTVTVWGITAAITACVVVGTHLLFGSGS